jgi:hypothetical protein
MVPADLAAPAPRQSARLAERPALEAAPDRPHLDPTRRREPRPSQDAPAPRRGPVSNRPRDLHGGAAPQLRLRRRRAAAAAIHMIHRAGPGTELQRASSQS